MINYIYAEIMNKNKKSKSNTEKYNVLPCKNSIDNNIDTSRWIELTDNIKKNKDLLIFNAILLNNLG